MSHSKKENLFVEEEEEEEQYYPDWSEYEVEEEYAMGKSGKKLYEAIENRNIEEVKRLLDNYDIDLNITYSFFYNGEYSKSFLGFAVEIGNPEIVKLLIDNGSEIENNFLEKNSSDNLDEYGDYEDFEPEIIDIQYDPLYIALKNKNKEIIQILIDKGANYISLINELINFDYEEPLQILLSMKVDLNKQMENSPLIHAIKKGKIKYVQMLLIYGADPNIEYYSTPLRVAYDYSPNYDSSDKTYSEIIKLLLEAGANPLNSKVEDEESWRNKDKLHMYNSALKPYCDLWENNGSDIKSLVSPSPTELWNINLHMKTLTLSKQFDMFIIGKVRRKLEVTVKIVLLSGLRLDTIKDSDNMNNSIEPLPTELWVFILEFLKITDLITTESNSVSNLVGGFKSNISSFKKQILNSIEKYKKLLEKLKVQNISNIFGINEKDLNTLFMCYKLIKPEILQKCVNGKLTNMSKELKIFKQSFEKIESTLKSKFQKKSTTTKKKTSPKKTVPKKSSHKKSPNKGKKTLTKKSPNKGKKTLTKKLLKNSVSKRLINA